MEVSSLSILWALVIKFKLLSALAASVFTLNSALLLSPGGEMTGAGVACVTVMGPAPQRCKHFPY